MTREDFPAPVRAIASAFHLVAGVLLLIIIVLTVGDVLSRNIQDKSILGTIDITTMLLVGVAFLGLATAEIEGRHVTVDLIEMQLKRPVRVGMAILRLVLLVLIGLLLVWGLVEVLQSAFERSETTNDILRLPTWPAKLVLLLSFAYFFFVAIWKAVWEIKFIRSGGEDDHESFQVVAAKDQAEEIRRAEEDLR